MKNKYLLAIPIVALCLFSNRLSAQYTVSAIPHQAYAASLPIAFTADDTFSAPIPLGFDFAFFGNTYQSVNVSTNGYVEFGGNYTEGSFSPWAFNIAIPSAAFGVKNSFFGCYHDLNNADAEGTITYGIVGTAPYRKFVVIYDNNSHFSCGPLAKTSMQMILYETLNIMDSQIVEKQICSGWNSGAAVIGIIDASGLNAFTPPGRNTGPWEAAQEGWRFSPTIETTRYSYIKCDDDTDGLITFDLGVAQSDLWAANPASVSFYATENDAIGQTGALETNYTNTSNPQTIYASVDGQIISVVLRVVDCNTDYDGDTAETAIEDVNTDTNLANDDTDNDGIPDFIDNDDDGDLILTNEEYVFGRNTNALLDTDADGIPNYLDNDDDGDNVLTINEDYNGNNDPSDDDTDNNGTPDYLQSGIALGVAQNAAQLQLLNLYPNPASDALNIENKTGHPISEMVFYTANGALVRSILNPPATLSIADLPTGLYFVKIYAGPEIRNAKLLKK